MISSCFWGFHLANFTADNDLHKFFRVLHDVVVVVLPSTESTSHREFARNQKKERFLKLRLHFLTSSNLWKSHSCQMLLHDFPPQSSLPTWQLWIKVYFPHTWSTNRINYLWTWTSQGKQWERAYNRSRLPPMEVTLRNLCFHYDSRLFLPLKRYGSWKFCTSKSSSNGFEILREFSPIASRRCLDPYCKDIFWSLVLIFDMSTHNPSHVCSTFSIQSFNSCADLLMVAAITRLLLNCIDKQSLRKMEQMCPRM